MGGEHKHTTVDYVSFIVKKYEILMFRDLEDELINEVLSVFPKLT